LEVEGVSGGLRRQTGVLVGRGENLTRRVGTLLLMTAEELPSSRCFFAVGDIFFSAGSGKLTILASIPLRLRCQNHELAPAMGR